MKKIIFFSLVFFSLVFFSLVFFSCSNNKDKSTVDNSALIGNWSSIENDIYEEYYFNVDKMYIYSPYSGNTLQYNYMLKSDSIFRYFIHPEVRDKKYTFFSRVVKFDDSQINFKNKTLYKLKKNNTLEMLVNEEIDSKIYFESCSLRESILRSSNN